MREFPKRKPNRLIGYDYSKQGAYFVTICTAKRAELFGEIKMVGANFVRPFCVRPVFIRPKHDVAPSIIHPLYENQMQFIPSEIGVIVEHEIKKIPNVYSMISIPSYILMPNHVHMIIVFHVNENVHIEMHKSKPQLERKQTEIERTYTQNGRTQFSPTLSRIIKQWKGSITKQVGFSLWQKSFHDHIIRNEADFTRIAEYIKTNPQRWEQDILFSSK